MTNDDALGVLLLDPEDITIIFKLIVKSKVSSTLKSIVKSLGSIRLASYPPKVREASTPLNQSVLLAVYPYEILCI